MKNFDTGAIVFQDADDRESSTAHISIASFLSDGSQNAPSVFLIKHILKKIRQMLMMTMQFSLKTDLGNSHHSFSSQTQNHNEDS